jgi:L-alanine-DL-glutamate epimerase-like enolase superfamily enzyme
MPEHRIDDITVHHYRLPLDPPFKAAWDPNPRRSHTSTLVRVRAGGYEGVGSGDAMFGFDSVRHLFIGQDPFHIERHVQILDNLQFHYGRMWPLEVALWDLMGKIINLPLWKLLGGKRQTLPLYASTGARLPPEVRAESALRLKELGFPAIKIRLHADNPTDDVAIAAAVRRAVGDDMALLVDANRAWQMPWDSRPSWDYKTALWVAHALDDLGAYWLEEPLNRHDYEGLANLRRNTRLRIAGGEGNREFAEFRQYLKHGSLDVYQGDVVWSTGILRARNLAGDIEAAGAIYSPHTWGDGLVLLANLHVAAAVSNAPFVEFPLDPPYWTPAHRDFILPQALQANDGSITLPDAPGLGVNIDWESLEQWRIHTGAMEG